MHEIKTLGFIGLGVMGEPMCANLARNSGKPVIAFDLDPAPLERLKAENVAARSSVAEVGHEADLLFLSLPDGNALRAVCDELSDSMMPGKFLVDCTTAPVRLTREMAMRFEFLNIGYADAPIARTRAAARAGTLSVMVGATEEIFAVVRPFIDCFAEEVTLCGDVGSGQVVKLLNNMILAETVNALAEALTIGRRAGVDPKVLLETLSKGSADSFALRNHGMKAMLPGVFPKRAFPVTYMLKDLMYAQELAQDTGVPARGAACVEEMLRAAIGQGYGEGYFPVINAVLDPELKFDMPDGDD